MSNGLHAQLVTAATGVLLLTAILQVWRRSLAASIRLLALQGVALAGLVATIGTAAHAPEVIGVALLVLGVKAGVLPWALGRTARLTGAVRENEAQVNPTSGLLISAALTMLAYVVSQPILAVISGPGARAVPAGLSLVLLGFLVLVTTRSALSLLIGFVMLDNGIATVAFLTAGGLPLVVELGAALDVLLVVLILRVLTGQISLTYGATDLDDLTELHD